MASSGHGRRDLLIAGGVLSIVAGICQIICGGVLVVDFLFPNPHCWRLIEVLLLPFLPAAWQYYVLWGSSILGVYLGVSIWGAIIGGCLGILGIAAVVGGISATRGRRFALSLAGAMCALPSVFLGIPAVILVALGKREFGVKA
jgi:hypothetical protein